MRHASRIIRQWEEMSLERLRAAKSLLDAGFHRDSVSRSYYAAYCAATSRVTHLAGQFAQGRHNPSHEQLPELVANLAGMTPNDRRRTKTLLRELRQAREDADYRPHALVSRTTALVSIQKTISVQAILEVGEQDD